MKKNTSKEAIQKHITNNIHAYVSHSMAEITTSIFQGTSVQHTKTTTPDKLKDYIEKTVKQYMKNASKGDLIRLKKQVTGKS